MQSPAAAQAPVLQANTDTAAVPHSQGSDDKGKKQPLTAVPCVNVLAAADSAASTAGAAADETEECDDGLPLAVMVKQCLSGNSFMYTCSAHNSAAGMVRSGNSVSNSPGQKAMDYTDSSEAHTLSDSSGAQQPPQNSKQDSEQLADQPNDKLLAEQQDVVSRFNAFRSKLGVKPGNTMHCDVVRSLQGLLLGQGR
jgi:hypothetical protein